MTYRNPNATPLELNLAFSPKDQNGVAAPAGLFTLPASVTVPARTTAKVTLTIDPSKAQPGRQYQDRITATATGIVVRTPVSVTFELESYDVTVDVIDRNGNRVDNLDDGRLSGQPYLVNAVQAGDETYLRLRDGRFVARMQRGAYATALHVFTPSEDGPASLTLLHTPRFTVTAPTTVTLDAREAVRTTATVQAEGARTSKIGTSLSQSIGPWSWSTAESYGGDVAEPVAYALPGQTTSRPYDFLLYQRLSAPDREYELALGNPDGVPADPTFAVADSDLADVTVTFAAPAAGMTGTYYHMLTRDFGGRPPGFSSSYEVSLPATKRHLISATVLGAPAEWESRLFVYQADGSLAYDEVGRPERFEAGRSGTIKLGTAAFTPQGGGEITDDRWMQLIFRPYNSSGGADLIGSDGPHRGDIVLKRNGVQIAEVPNAHSIFADNLPAGTATYTAVMHANRTVPWSPYVPSVSGTWTFTATTPTEGSTPVNLISTRVSGAFDGLGRAPAGTTFPLTLDVDGAAGGVATVTARVSYDDGQTWTSVPVSNAPGTWVATVTHPANPASPFVSLRIVVTDQQGNSGGWTATRAYRLAS